MCSSTAKVNVEIVPLEPGHWEHVRQIYLEGIATGDATFEISAPSWEAWDANHLKVGRIVAISAGSGRVVGWAALNCVSTRSVYAGVAEVSVYVANEARQLGVGKALLSTLVQLSEQTGIWTLQASVFPENVGSLALHKSCGFREVGIRERIGRLNGVWRDTILLERRSKLVGVERNT
jgi:L-amino acid N-acyltransferase YncA